MKPMRCSCPRLAADRLADRRFVRAGAKAWTGFGAPRLASGGWQENRGEGARFSAAQLNCLNPDLDLRTPFRYPRFMAVGRSGCPR